MPGNRWASTGISQLDSVIHGLRTGDNVVWQVGSIDDYRCFVHPFVQTGINEGRRVVYLRFGNHERLIDACTGLTVYHLDAGKGFEGFSSEVHRIISKEGKDVYYVFDSLTELLSSWATDLMTGNFFRVTCPYLFKLDTIAYFAILRNRLSHDTIARIRETTQLFLDIFEGEGDYFVHPLKVWNRYSPTMFLPHLIRQGEEYIPVTGSVEASRLFSQFTGPGNVERKLDFWDRIFLKARELSENDSTGKSKEYQQMLKQLCSMLLGKDAQIQDLAVKYFTLEDLLDIHNRLIGSGSIGGKSVGMLLARKILLSCPDSSWREWLETHDSFYIGADLYYTYLVENDCWELRMDQKKEDKIFELSSAIRERLLQGYFPGFVKQQFYDMLDYFGQAPIIVRSSSLLEDSFGNAFAGKYESVFCVNQGSPAERYDAFEKALKLVYASTMSEDALVYRQQRGLADREEQMAVLVQRVSGSNHSDYFLPDIAGVSLSYNPYVWREDIQAEGGMMRLVLGLGTRAVDRVEDDYPRVLALDNPCLRPDTGIEDMRTFSQHQVDVLDISRKTYSSIPLDEAAILEPPIKGWNKAVAADHDMTQKLKKLGINRKKWILNFDGLIKSTPFLPRMRMMMRQLEDAYDYPVDTEFTANFIGNEDIRINLLQCRPLQLLKKTGNTGQMDKSNGSLFFRSRGGFMGYGVSRYPNWIVFVKPERYIKLAERDKYQVARLVGKLNRILAKYESGTYALIGPGRWGTSTPSLGVPVSFAEISNCKILVEIAVKEQGIMPELSFGTHFFQDLVETGIFYVALFTGEKEVEFYPDILEKEENIFSTFIPQYKDFADCITVLNLSSSGRRMELDINIDTKIISAYITD